MAAQNSGLAKFISCGNTLVRWSKGILNSFDCRHANGFTDEVNNKIKILKCNVYGYRNFRRFCNRILRMFSFVTQKGASFPLLPTASIMEPPPKLLT
jgi:transposase